MSNDSFNIALKAQVPSSDNVTAFIVLSIFTGLFYIGISKLKSVSKSQAPFAGAWNTHNLLEIVRSRFLQDRKEIYRIGFPHRDVHVLPLQLLKDYGWASESKVSSSIDLYERLHGGYLEFASLTPEAPGDCMGTAIAYAKGPMTKSQDFMLPSVWEECSRTFAAHVQDCKDWKAIGAHQLAVRLPLNIYERLFVGEETAADPAWMQAVAAHTASVGAAAGALSRWGSFLRPIAAMFLPELKRLTTNRERLIELLTPLHQQMLLEVEQGKTPPRSEEIGNYIRWWVNNAGPRKGDTRVLLASLVGVSFAGIQSSGTVLVQALYDLAAHPEYLEPMRKEVEEHLGLDPTDHITVAALNKLDKMDSFVKESQRQTHGNILSVYRKIRQPLTLSNGFQLPANSYVAVPGSVYASVDEKNETVPFDGFRWIRGRENKRSRTYTEASFNSVEFGYGSHACPGRFMAANVLKTILAYLILNYDVRFPLGQSRPAPVYNNILMLLPNTNAKVELRARL